MTSQPEIQKLQYTYCQISQEFNQIWLNSWDIWQYVFNCDWFNQFNQSNQTIKFCQLIEYNMQNDFLEKSYTKCDGVTILWLFLKNQNWAYIWINSSTFYKVCLYCIRFIKFVYTVLLDPIACERL